MKMHMQPCKPGGYLLLLQVNAWSIAAVPGHASPQMQAQHLAIASRCQDQPASTPGPLDDLLGQVTDLLSSVSEMLCDEQV